MAKKKQRKHNARKRSERFFGNTRVWSWESDYDQTGLRSAYGETKQGVVWMPVPPTVLQSFLEAPHNWSIGCRALCQAPDGDEWVEWEAMQAKQFRINDIGDYYHKMRAMVMEEVQQRHVIDVGWIAQTYLKTGRIDDESWILKRIGKPSQIRRESWIQSLSIDPNAPLQVKEIAA